MNKTNSSLMKQQLSELPFKPPFFYGWVIVGISALVSFFSGPGQTYGVATFVDSYITEFGWSRSLVASLYSAGTLLAGFFVGVIGGFYDRYGHRIMTALIIAAFGIACLWMSFVNSVIMLFAGFFLIRLLGQGSMSLSSRTLPPQWFLSNKGKALSIVSLGGTISFAVLPPLNTWLIQTFGWQFGWRFWTILLWVFMIPTTYYFIRNRPEDVGLRPDNRMTNDETDEVDLVEIEEDSWTVKETIQTQSFWLLLYCSMVTGAIATGLVFHQLSIMEQVGLSPMVGALILSSMSIVSLPVSLIAGPVADKIPARYLLALAEGLLAVSLITLLFTNSVQTAVLYGVLLGVSDGLTMLIGSFIWPDYFGRKHLASIRGVTMMAGVIGTALGPLPLGYSYDRLGGYQPILLIFLVFPLLAIIAALLATPPKKTRIPLSLLES